MNQFTIKSRSKVLQYLATIQDRVRVLYVVDSERILIIVPDLVTSKQNAATVKDLEK